MLLYRKVIKCNQRKPSMEYAFSQYDPGFPLFAVSSVYIKNLTANTLIWLRNIAWVRDDASHSCSHISCWSFSREWFKCRFSPDFGFVWGVYCYSVMYQKGSKSAVSLLLPPLVHHISHWHVDHLKLNGNCFTTKGSNSGMKMFPSHLINWSYF